MNTTALNILRNSTYGAFCKNEEISNDTELEIHLKESIEKWNLEYQQGNPSISDYDYDQFRGFYENHFGEIESHAEIIDSDERKKELPITVGSMNKCTTLIELKKWAELKKFDFGSTEFVLTPKYDGITLVNDEVIFLEAIKQRKFYNIRLDSFTKGKDGFGLYVPEHFRSINNGSKEVDESLDPNMHHPNLCRELGAHKFSRGEAIIKKSIFESKYSIEILGEKDGFKNPRNFVASRFVEKMPNKDQLSDIDYIRFHLDNLDIMVDKSNMLDLCNQINSVKIPYVKIKGSDITEELLKEFFIAWSKEYELDGLIIDVNDFILRQNLGLETSTNNPCYARAYKSTDFDPEAKTKVIEVINQIDKNGVLNPVLLIEPIKLGGVTIGRVHGKNHRFMNIYGIGVGSNLTIRRSGNVIAEVVEVEGFPTMDVSDLKKLADKHFNPYQGISESRKLKLINESIDPNVKINNYEYPQMFLENVATWDDSFTNLVLCDPDQNDDSRIKKIVSFFVTIGAEGISDGLIKDLYERGFSDVKEILSLTDTEILTQFDGWGEKKAINFINSIQKSLKEVDAPTLAHATGFFGFLGSKKLALVENLTDRNWIPNLEDLNKIEGISDVSAEAFIGGWNRFWNFLDDTNIKLNIKKPKEALGNKMENQIVVFTGVRDKSLEAWIEQSGGKIGSSVSKNTTHLVMKEIGSGSSKESKAMELGIQIETLESFKEKYQ